MTSRGNWSPERTPGPLTQLVRGAAVRGQDPGPLAFVCVFPLPTSQWRLWSSGSVNHTFVPWALEAECLQCHPRGSSSRAL